MKFITKDPSNTGSDTEDLTITPEFDRLDFDHKLTKPQKSSKMRKLSFECILKNIRNHNVEEQTISSRF